MDELEARIKDAIGDQGDEGEAQLVRVLRMLAAGVALQQAARGGEQQGLGPPLENQRNL